MVQSEPEKAVHLAQLMGQLIDNKEWKKAFIIGECLNALDPEDYFAYRGMAHTSCMLGDYTAAEEYTKKALEHGDDDIETLFMMSRIYSERGDVENEIVWLNKALEKDPTYTKGAYYLAVANLSLGNFNEGEEILRSIIRIHPDNISSRSSLADLYVQKNRLDEAAEQLDEAIKIDSKNIRLSVNLGNIKKLQSKYDEALNQFLHALDLNPGNPALLHEIGNLYTALKKPNEALGFYQMAHTNAPDHAPFSLALGKAYLSLHQYSDCIAASSVILRHDPDMRAEDTNPGLHATTNIGLSNLYQGNLKEAEACFRKNLQLTAASNFNLGLALHWQEKYDDALAYFLHAVEFNPDNAPYWDMVGNAWLELNDLENAKKAFERAIGLDPSLASAQYDLGVVFSRMNGKEAEAMKQFRQAIALDEKFPLPYYTIACLHALEGKKAEALEYLDKAVALGFMDRQHVDEDHDLDILRTDPEFLGIMEKMVAKKPQAEAAPEEPEVPAPVQSVPEPKPGREQKKTLGSGNVNTSMDNNWERYIW